jgi:hypothetical protein
MKPVAFANNDTAIIACPVTGPYARIAGGRRSAQKAMLPAT